MPDLKLVTLYPTNFRDPVAALRVTADEIEAGKFGAVGCLGVVLMGDKVRVFGAGIDSDAPSVVCLLQAGANMLLNTIIDPGESHAADQKR